jgi:hypothetical protein
MGAIESGRWHDSHFAWKIGATSFVNVGAFAAVCANEGTAINAVNANAPATGRY